MPAIESSSTILVSSGSGFIGAWTCLQALKQGYSVRTTVRSDEKGEYLKKLFQKYDGKFEYTIVEDLEIPGVFDKAVQGVQGVAHTGSPFHFNVENDPIGKLINPAVKGTENILNSILSHGKDVKRVVITSSFASVVHPVDGVVTFTVDKDWNTHAPAEVEKKGNEVDGMTAYRASKTLAERAAWAFVEKNKPSWDLATVCPPLVLGPHIHQCESPEKLNTSSKMAYDLFAGKKDEASLKNPAGNCVDVRDVADVHIKALTTAAAGGQRLPASYGPYTWQDFADAIQDSKSISSEAKSKAVKGEKGAGKSVKQNIFDGSKSEKTLGIKYKDVQQQADDMALAFEEYEKRGWKGLPDAKLLAL